MTTEDDFQAALDAAPDDWQTRLVFADWLQERGDPRADGYRALGLLRRNIVLGTSKSGWWYTSERNFSGIRTRDVRDHYARCALPDDWYALLSPDFRPQNVRDWTEYAARRQADDDAALAFAKLPAGRRAELFTERHTEPLALPMSPRPKKKKR